MAAITSAQSGLWSEPGTWVGGAVPQNLDTVTIQAGHTVTFDVNQSGWANGLGGLVISGTLAASTAPGNYVLKMAGNVTGTGVLRAGTAETPYPTGGTFTILLNGGYYTQLTGQGSYQLYCAEPQYKLVRLTADVSAGATVLPVDTDVASDLWQPGNLVRVDNINRVQNSEERTIASVGANSITLTSGLSSAKIAGTLVILVSRNVRIVGTGPSAGTGIQNANGGESRAEIRALQYGVNGGTGHTITGTVSGCTQGVNAGTGHAISGTVSGCGNGVNSGAGHTISGTISGCGIGVNGGTGHTVSGTISGCNQGVYYSSVRLISATLEQNIYDIRQSANISAYSTLFASGTENFEYYFLPATAYAESFDHDRVPGAYKAWTQGGISVRQSDVVPGGKPWSYRIMPEDAARLAYVQRPLVILPNFTLTLHVWLRKSASMVWLPRVQIVDPGQDPLADGAYTPLAEFVMTDSVNTWEQATLTYVYTGDAPLEVWVRALAQNTGGDVYAYWEAEPPQVPVPVDRRLAVSVDPVRVQFRVTPL